MSGASLPPKFTQSDSRQLASVKRESYRYWREAIPYLASHRGANAALALSDVLGLMVVRELSKTLAVNIGDYKDGLSQLFDGLKSNGDPLGGALGFALLQPKAARLIGGTQLSDWASEQPSITIPLQPLVIELTRALKARGSDADQASLAF